jgi:hypothetical protein
MTGHEITRKIDKVRMIDMFIKILLHLETEFYSLQQRKLTSAMTSLTCTWVMPRSDLVRNTDHPEIFHGSFQSFWRIS